MASEKFKYISNISKIISNNYNGNTNSLNAFISSIELANDITEKDEQPILVKFIKTKLEGIALEAIPDSAATANDIVDALRTKIKVENSRIVLGRYMALRAERSSLSKFQKDAEDLSDQLRRAFISEGMSHELAERMTIEKTVDMCRLSAKTNLVKSVLASSEFKSPKDVLAKLITESTTESTENTILYYRNNSYRGNASRGNFQRNFRGNFRGNFNKFNNGFRNNYSNNQNGYNNSSQNRSFSQNRGNRGNKGQNRQYNNSSSYNREQRGGKNDRGTYVRAFNEGNEVAPMLQRGTSSTTVTMSDL